MKERGLEKER